MGRKGRRLVQDGSEDGSEKGRMMGRKMESTHRHGVRDEDERLIQITSQ